MNNLNWNNLKEEKCPKCGAYLKKSFEYFCNFCNFNIAFGKVNGIIGKHVSLTDQANELIKKSRKHVIIKPTP